ncbi:MAG: radical SAM protein [Candidatus Aenigmarchaeota archaeon]|nr:radical SAM protein [Candidatus Aenigmarchaeota archaeon]
MDPPAKRAYVLSLGCATNRVDAETTRNHLRQAGYVMANSPETADMVVVNTCAFTRERLAASRAALAECRRRAPLARVIAGGCVPAIAPGTLAEAGPFEILQPKDLGEGLARLAPPRGIMSPLPASVVDAEGGRVHVRISTGCRDRCTYCSIWRAAGRTASLPVDHIIADARMWLSKGEKLICLVSEDVGAWGQDRGQNLSDLLRALGEARLGVPLRLGNIHPRWLSQITDALAEAIHADVIEPVLHLPLQSGSSRILARMGRRYSASEYASWLLRLRQRVPDLRLVTDVIAGFPGEEPADLAATLALLRAVRADEVCVFPFAVQELTAAAALPGQLSEADRTGRAMFLVSRLLDDDYQRSGAGTWADYFVRLQATDRYPVRTALPPPELAKALQRDRAEVVVYLGNRAVERDVEQLAVRLQRIMEDPGYAHALLEEKEDGGRTRDFARAWLEAT